MIYDVESDFHMKSIMTLHTFKEKIYGSLFKYMITA